MEIIIQAMGVYVFIQLTLKNTRLFIEVLVKVKLAHNLNGNILFEINRS